MPNEDSLLKMYNQLIDAVADAVHTADVALQPTMEELIENATEMAHQAQEVSVKDAEELSRYLQRDLSDALHSINTQGKELSEWLKFDYELVEDQFIDILSKAADKTWLTLNNFEDSKRVVVIYKTGEISAPGVLDCVSCSQSMQFKKSTRIPPCPKCHKTEFVRKPL